MFRKTDMCRNTVLVCVIEDLGPMQVATCSYFPIKVGLDTLQKREYNAPSH